MGFELSQFTMYIEANHSRLSMNFDALHIFEAICVHWKQVLHALEVDILNLLEFFVQVLVANNDSYFTL